MKRDGFTLLELILVIAIVGILAIMTAPKFYQAKDQAEDAIVRQVGASIETTITLLQSRYLLTGQSYTAEDVVENLNLQGMTVTIENL